MANPQKDDFKNLMKLMDAVINFNSLLLNKPRSHYARDTNFVNKMALKFPIALGN